MEINALVITLIVIIIFHSALMLYREFRQLRDEKNALREENRELKARIEKLEASSRKRLPWDAQENILDGMAALDALMHQFNFGVDMVENAKAHFAKSMAVGTKREGEK